MVSTGVEVFLTLCGIGLPAAAVFFAVRRWITPLSSKLFALLILVVLLFLGPTLWIPYVPVPLDEVARGYPYRGLFGAVTSKNPLTNDTVKQMLPWMQLVREQLFSFELPLWNPYAFSGYPLLGNAQSIPFSPFFLATIFVPLPKQIVAMAGLKAFTGLLFGFLLLREYGRSPGAALFGSVAFAFSVFQNVYLYYPLSAVTCLLPAVCFAALRCVRRPGGASFWLLALVTAAVLASGHPESAFHVAMAVAVLLVIESLLGKSYRIAFFPLGAALFGALISAPAWVPTLEVILHSDRLYGIGSGLVRTPEFPLMNLWAFLNPNGFGNPARGNWNWQYSYVMIASAYIGLLPLAAFPLAFRCAREWRRELLLAIATVLLLLVAMNWTALASVFTEFPPLSWVVHDRLRFVVCFFAALIAARVVDELPERWIFLAGGAAIVLILGSYVFFARLGHTLRWSDGTGLILLLLFVCFAGATRYARPLTRFIPAVAATAMTIELLVLNYGFNALAAEKYYRPEVPILRVLQGVPHDAPWRMVGRDWTFLPNGSVQYHVEDIRGSDPMALGSYARFFTALEIQEPVADVKRVGEVESPLLDYLNVRFLMTSPDDLRDSERWRRIYSGPDGEIFENRRVIPRFFIPTTLIGSPEGEMRHLLRSVTDFRRGVVVAGVAAGERRVNGFGTVSGRQTSPRRFRVSVEADRPLVVASSEPNAPGWCVWVNGKRGDTVLVNGAFVGFRVGAGLSKVILEYRPASFFYSLGVAFLAAVAGVVMSWRRRHLNVT